MSDANPRGGFSTVSSDRQACGHRTAWFWDGRCYLCPEWTCWISSVSSSWWSGAVLNEGKT